MNRFKLLIFFIALSIFFSSSMGQPKKKEPEDPTKIFDDSIEALDVSAFEEVLKKGADPNARPVFWF